MTACTHIGLQPCTAEAVCEGTLYMPRDLSGRSNYENLRFCEEHRRCYQRMADDRPGYFLSVVPIDPKYGPQLRFRTLENQPRRERTELVGHGETVTLYGEPSDMDGYILGGAMLNAERRARDRARKLRPWWRFW